jgi:hypothetical protein
MWLAQTSSFGVMVKTHGWSAVPCRMRTIWTWHGLPLTWCRFWPFTPAGGTDPWLGRPASRYHPEAMIGAA